MITPDGAVIRIFLAPVLIVGATFVGRRLGPAAGGLVAGLPLTSGPVSCLLLAEHGRAFAEHAAVGTIRGLAATVTFIAAFTVGAHASWIRTLVLACVASLIVAAAIALAAPGLWLASTILTVMILSSFALVPVGGPSDNVARPPWWDLPVRALLAGMMVWALVASATVLGPEVTGLLSPAPVFAAIMLTFAALHGGTQASVARGMLHGTLGLWAFLSAARFFCRRGDGQPMCSPS